MLQPILTVLRLFFESGTVSPRRWAVGRPSCRARHRAHLLLFRVCGCRIVTQLSNAWLVGLHNRRTRSPAR